MALNIIIIYDVQGITDTRWTKFLISEILGIWGHRPIGLERGSNVELPFLTMYTSIKSERRKHVTDNVEEKPNNIQLQRVHANIFRGLLNLVFFSIVFII